MAPHSSTLAWEVLSHGWRSLEACSPWGRWGSDTTERLHFHFSLSRFGEGNGSPLQCSCLENPRDGRAWWAALYGATQSRTRLKRLSNSSSSISVSSQLSLFSVFLANSCEFISLYFSIYLSNSVIKLIDIFLGNTLHLLNILGGTDILITLKHFHLEHGTSFCMFKPTFIVFKKVCYLLYIFWISC